jgi:hypothetical protein
MNAAAPWPEEEEEEEKNLQISSEALISTSRY